MRAAIAARSASRIRSLRSDASCQTHGPTTSASAPASAPGATKCARRAEVVEHDDRAGHREGDAGDEERAAPGRRVAPRRASSTTPASRRPAPRTTENGTPNAPSSAIAKRQDENGDDRAAPARPDPEGEVEEDPGPARQREQREDEAHERRVDAERIRDAAADAGDDAVALAPLEREDGELGHEPPARPRCDRRRRSRRREVTPPPVSTRTFRAVVVAARARRCRRP